MSGALGIMAGAAEMLALATSATKTDAKLIKILFGAFKLHIKISFPFINLLHLGKNYSKNMR
jgi:hypothetical protein